MFKLSVVLWKCLETASHKKVLLGAICALGILFFISLDKWRSEEVPSLPKKEISDEKKELLSGPWLLRKAKILEEYQFDRHLCKALETTLFQGKSVLDLGTGIGYYGQCMLRMLPPQINFTSEKEEEKYISRRYKDLAKWWTSTPKAIKSWEGYDGAPSIESLSVGLVNQWDLSQPRDLGKKFDWVMSLEVGEHIPKEYESIFLQNVVKHAREGIVLSWAVKGQRGRSHVNNKDNQEVIDIMKNLGFDPRPDLWKPIRHAVQLWWFRNTLMVFTPRK